jgi:opacity protein-like surface antigen
MRSRAIAIVFGAAFVLAASGSAFAADLNRPVYAPPPPPAPIWNWTGFYLGGNLGVGLSRDNWSGNPVDFASAIDNFGFCTHCVGTNKVDLGSHNDLGILGGVTVGYNYQFPNTPLLLGIEGEWMFSDLEGNHENTQTFSGFDQFGTLIVGGANERLSTDIHDLATIGVRLGITSGPEDRTLWYVKGGGAWVRENFGETDHANALQAQSTIGANGTFDGSGNVRVNQWGWFVGTGVEWGLIGNWSAKIEYEFLDFANHDFTMPVNGTFNEEPITTIFSGSFNRGITVNQQIHVVKVGLNYRFWTWGP